MMSLVAGGGGVLFAHNPIPVAQWEVLGFLRPGFQSWKQFHFPELRLFMKVVMIKMEMVMSASHGCGDGLVTE